MPKCVLHMLSHNGESSQAGDSGQPLSFPFQIWSTNICQNNHNHQQHISLWSKKFQDYHRHHRLWCATKDPTVSHFLIGRLTHAIIQCCNYHITEHTHVPRRPYFLSRSSWIGITSTSKAFSWNSFAPPVNFYLFLGQDDYFCLQKLMPTATWQGKH